MKRKMLILILLLFSVYLIRPNPLLGERVLKFSRIGQRESLKMGEKYSIAYQNINPENTRIRYISSPKEGEYYLELTHYTGLEKDEWIGETIKKYENEISKLKVENQSLKQKAEARSMKPEEGNQKTQDRSQEIQTNQTQSRIDYNILNLKPLQNDIEKKINEIEKIDNDLFKNQNEFQSNQTRVEYLNKYIKSLGNDPKNKEIIKINQAELENLLKRNLELLNINQSLYLEKIKLMKSKRGQENELENQIKLRNLFIVLTILSLIIVIFLYINNRQKKKANKIIENERQKSDKLLLNILPPVIAKRLKDGESMIADYFDEASVIFIDISHFTEFSKDSKPERIVEILNRIYIEFDRIATRHGLEKIKTIGDCYMAASGIPLKNKDHALQAARFAIDAMNEVDYFDTGDGMKIRFKAGIDCGPVVAGVIGDSKFIYDIWGDTVNTASRMEENSGKGNIQITNRFKEALITNKHELQKRSVDLANSIEFNYEDRGEIDIKGKGLMKTWFLKSKNNK